MRIEKRILVFETVGGEKRFMNNQLFTWIRLGLIGAFLGATIVAEFTVLNGQTAYQIVLLIVLVILCSQLLGQTVTGTYQRSMDFVHTTVSLRAIKKQKEQEPFLEGFANRDRRLKAAANTYDYLQALRALHGEEGRRAIARAVQMTELSRQEAFQRKKSQRRIVAQHVQQKRGR